MKNLRWQKISVVLLITALLIMEFISQDNFTAMVEVFMVANVGEHVVDRWRKRPEPSPLPPEDNSEYVTEGEKHV